MNTIPTLPQHLKPGDKIYIKGAIFPDGQVFIVDRFGTDKLRRTFMYCKIEGVKDKVLTLEYYKGQIKVDKIIG